MRISSILIMGGIVLVAIGLTVRYAPWAFSWFGRLPGDIRIEGESGSIFIPITSMLLVSVVASLAITFVNRIRG